MKKHLLLTLGLSLLATSAFAQMTDDDDDCDPNQVSDCDSKESQIKEASKNIYPWKPLTTGKIRERIETLTENKSFLWDIREMDRRGLTRANTKVQPWGGSFWPLYQGGVANTYQNKDFTFYIFTPLRNTMWQANVKDYKKRVEKVHPKVYELDEKELAKLAPSEKYDILLGDTSFSLTNTVWDYVEKYGEDKHWGFLTKIDMPDGYRLPKPGSMIALWEGICHGWALGAGYTPRPEKTVNFTLPNGKKLPFFPNDIKALASLNWANSNVQDNVLFEGNRCNKKNPDKDKFGRFIDTAIDGNDTELLPRCADVHPAIYHVSVVNIMGVEGRPIVYDHNPKLAIANQPASGYEYTYYNLATGKDGNLNSSMIALSDYKDPYAESRNPEAVYVVGVEMNAKYVDWQQPRKKVTDSPKDDKVVDNKFIYDLEINAEGKIVGGQWHVSKKPGSYGGTSNQPDYFWLAPRNYKDVMEKPVKGLPFWPKGDFLPAPEYAQAAKGAHSFMYEESAKFFGSSPKCKVMPLDPKAAPQIVDCEFKKPKPQALINVVDRLLELSKN